MIKQEPTLEQKIQEAVIELQEAMLESIQASKEETEIAIRKKKSHYRLQQAEQQINNLRWEAVR